ncbi:MAG: DUF2332 family protein [Pseudomonadota bacterium]
MGKPVNSAADAFALQASHCRALGSPFTADLCLLFAENLDDSTAVGRHVLNWMGNPSHRVDAVPLRLCAGLHSLVLTGVDDELVAAYPPHAGEVPPWPVIHRAVVKHDAFLMDWMTSPPQTNEVQRSNAIWPALQTIAEQTGLPLALWEIGASAGLNLQLDRFSFRHANKASGDQDSAVKLAPRWSGDAPDGAPLIVEKAGCDLNPLNPANSDHRLRLLSYVWAGQNDRVARTAAAIDLAQQNPVHLEQMDAVSWLRKKLLNRPTNACTVIYTTIAWQYLPDEDQKAAKALIAASGEAADTHNPLAIVHMEGDGQSPGASLTLRLWPQSVDCELARVDFHGRWVDWRGIS